METTPREEINILLLGETGVGKSTFINAFANYFKFNSLNNAISGEINVLITSTFTTTNEDYETEEITIFSERDDNDDDEDDYDDYENYNEDENDAKDSVGESCTKECGVYVFPVTENKIIRLIDTPGVGDTRGIEYDKKNFENILKNISHHNHLNGICILLKSNDARVSVTFKFCIQELLSHLHKNAKDNIVFCFTNTRGTLFRPGEALPVLQTQLNELEKKSGITIPINKETIYCFDNEPFRFLAAKKEGIKFTDYEKKGFSESWKKSAEESVRLLQHIKNREPHKIIDTISLNNARQTIMILREPLAEINHNIQENIAEVRNLKEEIEKADLTEEELRKKLYIPHIKLEMKKMERPKVVCTKSNCRTSVIQEDCHVKWKWLNTFMQKHNGVMMFGVCKSCGCHAKNHKAIFYKSVSNRIIKIDENIKDKISKNKLDQIDIQNHIKKLQERIDLLKKHQNTVKNTMIKFTHFLKQNAIATFNDAYVEYLNHIIHLEKQKIDNTSEEILEGLEDIKSNYEENVKNIKSIEKNTLYLYTLSSEDIFELEKQLYSLSVIGKYLQDIKNEEERAFRYKEKRYRNMLDALTKIFKNS